MTYQDDVEALRSGHPDLAGQLAGFHGLENVLTWMMASGMPLGSIDLIAQDEYSHDFLVPWGPGGRYLVFGMT